MTSLLSAAASDARQAWRSIARAYRFSVPAAGLLAVAIGAAVTVFTIAYAAVLQPLPFPDPEQLVVISAPTRDAGRDDAVASGEFYEWRERAQAFSQMAAAEYWAVTESGDRAAQRRRGLRVTGELFSMVGVAARLGRALTPDDARPGAAPVVVIGHALWQERFGGRDDALGAALRLDGERYEVVGVMPADYQFPTHWAAEAEFWAPLLESAGRRESRRSRSLRAFGRLAPATTSQQAQDELQAILTAQQEALPEVYPVRRASVEPLHEVTVAGARPAAIAVSAGVGLLLILGCGNLAGLLILRGLRRRQELSVRAAMGAGRGRLVRQLLIEGVLLAAFAAAGGLLVSSWTLGAVSAVLSANADVALLSVGGAPPRWIVFAIAAGLALVTAVAFSVLPAWQAARGLDAAALRTRHASSGFGARRLGRAVVVLEVALAFMLLVGGLLAARSWTALYSVDPGFEPQQLLSVTLPVTGSRAAEPGHKQLFYEQVLERVRAAPGVAAASLVNHVPLAGDSWRFSVHSDNPAAQDEENPRPAAFGVAAPGYFAVLGAELLTGREFSATDSASAEPVAVVNETFAQRHWPGATALGRRVRLGGDSAPWRRVIGVVGNLRQQEWDVADQAIFLPFAQDPLFRDRPDAPFAMSLVVRIQADAASVVDQIRAHVHELDPYVPVSNVTLLSTAVDDALFQPRWTARLLGAFAGSGLLLATLGIYALIAFGNAQRRREFGLRLAVGATPARLRGTVLAEGSLLLAGGLALGALGAWLLAGVWSSRLYAVAPTDFVTWGLAALMLALAGLAAADIPARRAALTSPAAALEDD